MDSFPRGRGICYYLQLGLQQIPTLSRGWGGGGVGVYIDSCINNTADLLLYKIVFMLRFGDVGDLLLM